MTTSILPGLIRRFEAELLKDWVREQRTAVTLRSDLLPDAELERQSAQFLAALQAGLEAEAFGEISDPGWERARGFLEDVARSRGRQGFTPSETATFLFSLKQPVFKLLQRELEGNPAALVGELWEITVLVDRRGLFTGGRALIGREVMITRLQAELLERSTPVVKLWDRILALPLIGTLDSSRTQVVMESLLQAIVDTGSSVAIIDITGVPTVDTLVAQHLMKTVAAARLMGAECVISGIRPAIAQSMVHLGVSFTDIVTKATLADAIRHAFARTGVSVGRAAAV
ncbi:MAG: STAS domain-containing protein [Holophagales bacterium]|nr:STAS domain-containing protein [Holophagales bacterium]